MLVGTMTKLKGSLPHIDPSHARIPLSSHMKPYIVSNIRQMMNTKLFFTTIVIATTFSIAVTAITTPISAQNMTGGNMTLSVDGNMTSMGNNLTMEMDDKYTADS
jgi:hypothetical protein